MADVAAGEPDWIVRGGVATPEQLRDGTSEHRDVPGLTGFSVRRQPGKTVEELAAAGQFRNRIISVTTVRELVLAGQRAGYAIQVLPTPRGLYHQTVQTVVTPHPLPYDLATALSRAFSQRENPARAQW
jgi:hypothetical protein